MRTVWVMGDQLNRRIGALVGARTSDTRVLLVESAALFERGGFHRQRIHLVRAAMRRFAAELRAEGFDVDLISAPTLADGLEEHRRRLTPAEVVATEPNGRGVAELLARLGVRTVRSNQFLCHRDEFAAWAAGRPRLQLEDFYRWRRSVLGYLMEDGVPLGGRWNLDRDNRRPPPAGTAPWPAPIRFELDRLDRDVIATLPVDAPGAEPVGWWPTSRAQALSQLDHFVEDVLPHFGPYEDAMLASDWHLAHSLLSPALNLGLLLPGEVCDRVEQRYHRGGVPLNSAEGFIRQVVGWREFVWGISWLWPEQAEANALENHLPLPPAFTGAASTTLACLESALEGLHQRGWVHHIQRLMVLSNIANLVGVEPAAVRRWMRRMYVDGADWVMGPNVMGMGLWADGGRMSTKPYVSGGGYINKMSDHCRSCRYDPGKRVGEEACPLTTLYWDFLDRHRAVLASNHRMAPQYGTLGRLADLEELRARARHVIAEISAGRM